LRKLERVLLLKTDAAPASK